MAELRWAQRMSAFVQAPLHLAFVGFGGWLLVDPSFLGSAHAARAFAAGLLWVPAGLFGVAGSALLLTHRGRSDVRALPWMVRAWWALAFSALGYSFGTVALLGIAQGGP